MTGPSPAMQSLRLPELLAVLSEAWVAPKHAESLLRDRAHLAAVPRANQRALA